MTKRARPHFRVVESADGTPWIAMEKFDGDELNLFAKFVGFDLPPGTDIDKAEEIRRYLATHLVKVSET